MPANTKCTLSGISYLLIDLWGEVCLHEILVNQKVWKVWSKLLEANSFSGGKSLACREGGSMAKSKPLPRDVHMH